MNYKKVHIDFETRSEVDLKKSGTHVYVNHPSTDALCLAYAFDEQPVRLWKLGDPAPHDLMQAIHKGIVVAAHNAHFEFMVWNFVCYKKYGWPSIKIEQLDCTMVRAFSMGLPGKLETAAKAVGLKAEKDMKGHRIMMQLSKPRAYDEGTGQPIWWDPKDTDDKIDIAAKYEALYRYCTQDIIVERELDKRLLPLSDSEKKLWELDQKINYRGVYCELPVVQKAIDMVSIEKKRLDKIMSELTGGAVGTCNSSAALKDWINTHDIYKGAVYESDGPLKTYKEKGKSKRKKQWKKGELKICQGVGKDQLLDMLEMDLPETVRKVLLVRQEAAKSSTAKLTAMIEGASEDRRIRGCFQFYGAASTGRWAGRRIQLQNMTRPTIDQKHIESILEYLGDDHDLNDCLSWVEVFHGQVIPRISDCLRGLLTSAPGKKLVAADFSAIESRVLSWLSGQESKLNIYRGHGKIYEHNAMGIYGLSKLEDVTKDQRAIGKVSELALGYQGGVKAFHSMAKNYFIKVPDSQAEMIKTNWRRANPFVVQYWYDLERAAINAVEYPGQKFGCGPKGRQVIFLKVGSFLFCRLPSGRAICYPYPKMKMVKTPWDADKNALTYKGEENYQFVTKTAYGGLLAENITQAVSRDLLAEAMFRAEDKGYKIIMHVHDELVTEVDKNFGSVKELEEILCELPKWATDLPVQAEGWEGKRFRK